MMGSGVPDVTHHCRPNLRWSRGRRPSKLVLMIFGLNTFTEAVFVSRLQETSSPSMPGKLSLSWRSTLEYMRLL
jgi:hypothetical protein